jgi:hypothetical protein
MPSNKPILTEGYTPKERAKSKVWQGATTFALGACWAATTWFGYGFVWWGTIALAIAGFFWLLTGLITMYTGYE